MSFYFVYALQVLDALFYANFYKLGRKFEHSGLFCATLYVFSFFPHHLVMNKTKSKKRKNVTRIKNFLKRFIHLWSGWIYLAEGGSGWVKKSSYAHLWNQVGTGITEAHPFHSGSQQILANNCTNKCGSPKFPDTFLRSDNCDYRNTPIL